MPIGEYVRRYLGSSFTVDMIAIGLIIPYKLPGCGLDAGYVQCRKKLWTSLPLPTLRNDGGCLQLHDSYKFAIVVARHMSVLNNAMLCVLIRMYIAHGMKFMQ